MTPEKCILYTKSNITEDDIYANLNKTIEKIEGGPSDYKVVECAECKTLYLIEHNNFFENDSGYPKYETYVPVSDSELKDFREIPDKGLLTILQLQGPKLIIDTSKDGIVSVRWDK